MSELLRRCGAVGKRRAGVQCLGSFGLAAWGPTLAVVALGDTIRLQCRSIALGRSQAPYLGHTVLLRLAAPAGLFGPLQSGGEGVLPGLAALFPAGILITYLYYRSIERLPTAGPAGISMLEKWKAMIIELIQLKRKRSRWYEVKYGLRT